MSDIDELEVLLADGVIDEVLGRLKSGKEANISLVRRGDAVIAAKVYKDRATRSFKNNTGYKEGRKVRNSRTQRAMDSGGKFGRDAAEQAWKSAEADALYKLVGSGVRVPEPHMFYEGVLLMDVVCDADGHPAPRLIDVPIERDAALSIYADLVAQLIAMLCCDLIHGDLSPYNILAAADGPTIIDFPQVISAVHNSRAEFYFLRDFDNIVRFLAGFDPSLAVHTADGRAIWRAYVSRELTPQFVPPPPPPPRATRGPDRRTRPDEQRRGRDGRPQNNGPRQQQNNGPRQQQNNGPRQQNNGPRQQQNNGPRPQQGQSNGPRSQYGDSRSQYGDSRPQQSQSNNDVGADPISQRPQQNSDSREQQSSGPRPEQIGRRRRRRNNAPGPQQISDGQPRQNSSSGQTPNSGSRPQQYRDSREQQYGSPRPQQNSSQQQNSGGPRPQQNSGPRAQYGDQRPQQNHDNGPRAQYGDQRPQQNQDNGPRAQYGDQRPQQSSGERPQQSQNNGPRSQYSGQPPQQNQSNGPRPQYGDQRPQQSGSPRPQPAGASRRPPPPKDPSGGHRRRPKRRW